MPTALAVSPHLDDAVFSCGGTLAMLAQAGWRVVMTTVFTASVPDPQDFALACQTDKGLPAEADYMALRRDEDRDAARSLGIEPPRHAPFREAPHRGYGSPADLFSGVRGDDRIVPDLARALAAEIAETGPDLILAPQAIGGHVDHVQVVRALRELRADPPVLWWRDYPYTVRSPGPQLPFGALFSAMRAGAVRLDDDAQARKLAACAAYATQIGFQFGGRDGLARRLAEEGGVERFEAEGLLPPLLSFILSTDAGRV